MIATKRGMRSEKKELNQDERERVEHKEPFSLFFSSSINRNRTIISDAHSSTGLFPQTTKCDERERKPDKQRKKDKELLGF